MANDIEAAMCAGIEGSKHFVTFVTGNYLKKANGNGPQGMNDNVYFEFLYALKQKDIAASFVVVVMEPSMRNTCAWKGKVGGRLGNLARGDR